LQRNIVNKHGVSDFWITQLSRGETVIEFYGAFTVWLPKIGTFFTPHNFITY